MRTRNEGDTITVRPPDDRIARLELNRRMDDDALPGCVYNVAIIKSIVTLASKGEERMFDSIPRLEISNQDCSC